MKNGGLLKHRHILDNHDRKVVEYLSENLSTAKVFRLVSAYFTIYGYEALQNELCKVEDVRFLFGDPASVGEIDPGKKEQKSFTLVEEGLSPNYQLQQKHIAQQCAEWISKQGVEIRSIGKSNFLHGKMYLAESATGGAVVVGSSNFTRKGLGCDQNANVEINLATDEEEVLVELREWFDKLWLDQVLTKDVKGDILDALHRIGKDHSPEFIYYKTLYELFREHIEAMKDGERTLADIDFYSTKIWKKLYEFQRDGVKSIIAHLQKHGGCILADSVGLGKTYTALAVIKFFELRNERVLVLCPKKLRDNWAFYPAYNSHSNNPFAEDRFGYTLLSHTDLSRDTGKVGDIDLENFKWQNFDLVVIDESHNFRNDTKPHRDENGNIVRHSRYTRLLEEVIKAGTETKVLMLSATPVNISLIDLRNQIYLMTKRHDDTFRETLGISNVGTLLSRAQKAFRTWETDQHGGNIKDKSQLLEKLGADFFHLLGGVSIARSRRQIKKFYSEEIKDIGQFPKHEEPKNIYPPTDLREELSYKYLSEQIGKFALSVYTPSKYVVSEDVRRRLDEEKKQLQFNQEDRERYLIGMIRVNFLKRLESSAHSLTCTLERTIGKIEGLLEKIDHYEKNKAKRISELQADTFPDDDEEDEELFVNRARKPYHLSELDLSRWKQDLLIDKETLERVFGKVKAIGPDRDGKLQEIKQYVRERVNNPTINKDGRRNRKMLIFTTFADTAQYLYGCLQDLATKLGLKIAMISGGSTRTTFGENNFNAILTNFAPMARERREKDSPEGIDLLIATDCISEGQNLQDCDTVLNYDIHWNPVRLIQRFGRVDRIGSRNESVRMINFWPTKDMDIYLNLQARVHARMALADVAASGDDDPLNENAHEHIQLELNFRDRQLKKLQEEVLDIDDLSDSIVMSDFTLDYFFTQLLRYLERNKAELDAAPSGVYAITNSKVNDDRAGVIFFLRCRENGVEKGETTASPIHPYYMIYIRDNGDINYSCANARKVLEVFESLSIGKNKPLQQLCNQFDSETDKGKNMNRYNKLLRSASNDIVRANRATQVRRLGTHGQIDVKLPKSSVVNENFDLITWLIIVNSQS